MIGKMLAREWRRIRRERRAIAARWRALVDLGLARGSYSSYLLRSLWRYVRRTIRLRQMDAEGLFLSTNIETFGACNRTCSFCFNHERFEKRALGVMEQSLWYKIIDEFAALRFAGRLSPYFYGEPLLDKRLRDLMAYAREKCPLATIQINTNGDYLDEALLRDLVALGVDRLVVTNYDDDRKPHLEALAERFAPWIDYRHYKDFEIQNRAGRLYEKGNRRKNARCYRPSSQLVMNWNGDLALCCNDFYAEHGIGNARDSDLLSLWKGEPMQRFRRLLEHKGGRQKIDFCRNCDMYAARKVY